MRKLKKTDKKRTHKSPARARSLTDSQKKKLILDALRETMGIVTFACEKAQLSHKFYYRYMREDPEFAEEVRLIQEGVIDVVENQLYSNILGGDVSSTIFYLKTKARHRGYAEKVENFHQIESIVIKPYEESKEITEGNNGSTPLLPSSK